MAHPGNVIRSLDTDKQIVAVSWGFTVCYLITISGNLNPIQAGVFWNHLGWGGTLCPLCFSFICDQTKLGMDGMMVLWDKISQKP